MKKVFILLVTLLSVVSINAQDTTVQDVVDNVNNTVQTANNAVQSTANFADNMDDALVKILNGAMNLAQQTGEFVVEQGGDILKQFFMWKIAENVFYVVLGLLLLFIPYFIFKKLGCDNKADTGDSYYAVKVLGKYYSQPLGIAGFIFGVCLPVIAGLIMFCTCLFDLIYVIVAPKLYLIEYVVGLTKGGC